MRWLIISLCLLMPTSGFAAAGKMGGTAFGFNLGVVNSSQPSINQLVKSANSRAGGISTSELNQAYEAQIYLQYRFSGSIFAIQFRPSYFYQVEDGSGSLGTFKYDMQGYTLFPILRLYTLENAFMKFFLQVGMGYGRLNGAIQEGTTSGDAKVEFSGGTFGSQLGLGAEFCFTPAHCLNVEGNYRYLAFERFKVDKSSGTFDTAGGSLSQYDKGQELEVDGSDLSARMGGLMFMAGYTMWF
ncbi:MAG: outer membrane protein [Bdellovibrionales bacterium]